jgi:Uma2 family endonuclease
MMGAEMMEAQPMADSPQEKVRMTTEEYMALPESNLHTELIDGELIVYEGKDGMTPAPRDIHQQTSSVLFVFLAQHLPPQELRAAPTDVHLDDGTVVQPDIFWASAESDQCVVHDDGYLHGAPDFIVEILSPTTIKRDRGVKFDLYEKHGVREYWLVDPDGGYVEVYRLVEGVLTRQGLFTEGQQFTSPVLGEKSVAVDSLLGGKP